MGDQSSEMECLRADLARVTAERDEVRAELLRCTAECDEVRARGRELRREVEALKVERDRLQRACDEGLPREVIHCPACKVPHVEGPRHDDPTKDGRTRPHHTHRCYGCGHVWESGRWTFGVAPGGENEVTKRPHAAGLRDAEELTLALARETGHDESAETVLRCLLHRIAQRFAEVSRG